MKNMLERVSFCFRFAFRNLFKYKIRTLLLLFSFITLFIISLLSFSSKSIIEKYYYERMIAKYQDIDFYMTVSENTKSRFFSISSLKNDDKLNDYIDDYIPFFEINTLIKIDEFQTYVKVMASPIDSFEKIVKGLNYNQELKHNEILITSSLANKYNLVNEGEITLVVGEVNRTFRIVEIIRDEGIFEGDVIYLNKEHCLSLFLTALNPEYANMTPFLTNIYNTIYFSVQDDMDIQTAQNYITSIKAYENLEFVKAINYEKIDQLINRGFSLFQVLSVFVFLAVFLVLQSTFLLIFEEKKRSFAIVSILGGKVRFNYFIEFIEMTILFIFSLVIGIVSTNFIINKGLNFVGIESTYQINQINILISALIVIIIFLITSLIFYSKANQFSIQDTKENSDRPFSFKLNFIVLLIICAIYLLIEIVYQQSRLNIFVFLHIFLLFVLVYLISIIIIAIFQKILQRNNQFLGFHLKMILYKKTFYRYLTVILICIFSIYLLVGINDYKDRRIINFQNEYEIDYALVNIISRYDSIYQELNNWDNIKDVDKVIFYQDVIENENNLNFNYFISMDSSKIKSYFNINIEEGILNAFTPTVILPARFEKVYGYQVGDKVSLYLNPLYANEEFLVGGFYDNIINDIVFSNILFMNEYNVAPNSILINSKDDKVELKQQLINQYSKNLIFVIDFEELLLNDSNDVFTIYKYMNYIMSIIIGCFILSIFNHSILLFYDMKATYSRLFVIGSSISKLSKSLIIEQIIKFIAISITAWIGYFLGNALIRRLILAFNEYENINFSLESAINGLIITSLVFIISKLIYFLGLFLINPAKIIKSF